MTTSPKPTKDEAMKLGMEALTKAEDLLHKLEIYAVSRGLPYKDLRLDKDSVFRPAITAISEALSQPAADDKPVESGERAELAAKLLEAADDNDLSPQFQSTCRQAAAALLAADDSRQEALVRIGQAAICAGWVDGDLADFVKGKLLAVDDKAGWEVVAWKHVCNALCVNDLELWVDRCPHCGKPSPQPQAERPADHIEHHLDMVERPAERVALSNEQKDAAWKKWSMSPCEDDWHSKSETLRLKDAFLAGITTGETGDITAKDQS